MLATALYSRRGRRRIDRLARLVISAGGMSVIVSIALIFIFLLSVVLPLFRPATVELGTSYPAPGPGARTLGYILDEYRRVGVRFDAGGTATIFNVTDGHERRRLPLALATEARSFAMGESASRVFGIGLADGTMLLGQVEFSVDYPDGSTLRVRAQVRYPLGTEPIRIDPQGRALTRLAVQLGDEDQAGVLAWTADGRLLWSLLSLEESMAGDLAIVARHDHLLYSGAADDVTHLALEQRLWSAFAARADGRVVYYDIVADPPRAVQTVLAADRGARITAMELLSSGVSLLIGDDYGRIAQWAPVREQHNNRTLARLRTFDPLPGPVEMLAPEYYRKGFMASSRGHATLNHATSNRTLYQGQLASGSLTALRFAPRADAVLYEDDEGRLRQAIIDNQHPEFSMRAAWGKVWYEGRDGPARVWQSSSASEDFEPKFSLAPLAFGTLKAALYALLFSIPLAVLGAAYTAYFMTPALRAIVKPAIEIMEALPTVILGFLAGIWFAPLVEQHLAGVIGMAAVIPLVVLAAAMAWQAVPLTLRARVPPGWEAVLLAPVLVAGAALSLWLGTHVEAAFFGGDLPLWLNSEWGISYDQRNALVVGVAMGFAVIPTIFSISEDAIYGVPRSLVSGSLALGASQWQTLVRLVLLTASPGILSAIMIGLGRAVGETMIVIMATGNTPIIDFNIFQGFRALSANIAVEMPEAEVSSTHYRMLFMAALLLFIATFIFNTMAETVRHRLRRRYSKL